MSSSIMDALGVGPELMFEGKVYRLKPMTLIHAALFSAWLERRAYESAERAQSVLSAKNHERALAGIAGDAAEGVYDFGGERFDRAARSPSGVKQLMLLSLQDNHPEVDQEFVDRFFAAKTADMARIQAEKATAKKGK